MRVVRFEPHAWEEFVDWQSSDTKTWKKVVELINECLRTPFSGKGKPEGLKSNYKGYWSRRITQEHRLVYKVTENEIIVVSCYGHYN